MSHIFKKESTNICSPVKGMCIPITEVKDQVFSSKMMGDGFAVVPQRNTICSPIDGEITMAADTKHAVGMKRKDGLEILLHVGLDGRGKELIVFGKGKGLPEDIIRVASKMVLRIKNQVEKNHFS